MSTKSQVKKTIVLILATDERDAMTAAIIKANLVSRVIMTTPHDNGIEINLTYEARHEKSLFSLGRAFGNLERGDVPHRTKECNLFFCDKCGNTDSPSALYKNLCTNCGNTAKSINDKRNDGRVKPPETPPPEPPPPPEKKHFKLPPFKNNPLKTKV